MGSSLRVLLYCTSALCLMTANVAALRYLSRNLMLNRFNNQKSMKVFNSINDKHAPYRFKEKVISLLKNAFFNTANDVESIRNKDSIPIINIIITLFCIFGMPLFIAYCVQICGIVSLITGLYFIIKGMWDLNESLSLLVVPVRSLYKHIRHPIYSGLILLSVGISIVSNNVEKLVLSILLCYLTNNLVDIEESALIEKHYEYSKYREITIYKFVPNIV